MTGKEFDENIIGILNGDKNALKRIYDEFGHAVYSLALTILKDCQAAEDVSQEVFIKVWNNADKYKIGAKPKAWIMKITRNEAIDYMRKQKHEMYIDEIDGEYKKNRVIAEDNLLKRMYFDETVSVLPDTDREIIVMRILGDLTYKDISRLLKMPIGTVTWKYWRSLRKLREELMKSD